MTDPRDEESFRLDPCGCPWGSRGLAVEVERIDNWRVARDGRYFRPFYVQRFGRYLGLGRMWSTQRRFSTYEKARVYMDYQAKKERFERDY